MKKKQFGVSTRSDTKQAVQSQKQARSLKFRFLVEDGLYYPCSETKGADQPCSYCTADLCLWFRMRRFKLMGTLISFSLYAH